MSESKVSEIMPPLPQPVFESAEPLPPIPEPSLHTIQQKLWVAWKLYGALVQNEKLWKIINKPAAPESDKFVLQCIIVEAVQHLGVGLRGIPEDFGYIQSQFPQVSDCAEQEEMKDYDPPSPPAQ